MNEPESKFIEGDLVVTGNLKVGGSLTVGEDLVVGLGLYDQFTILRRELPWLKKKALEFALKDIKLPLEDTKVDGYLVFDTKRL